MEFSENMGTWRDKRQHKIKGVEVAIKYALLLIFLHRALDGTELMQVLSLLLTVLS
jgi:hypothetical protein